MNSTFILIGQKYSSSYFLIHQDLHDDHVIRGLHHMMSSTIRMLPRKQEKHLLSLICHKRKSGKILKEVIKVGMARPLFCYRSTGIILMIKAMHSVINMTILTS